ncbi:DUF86 domain-containing protein [Marinicrinis sediminis]|uniref:DUF86 domain-containing protein n=1 Tax=Marinicrinis sediminis TaxID=1652465 RepID=A0ABW5RCI9_9BACL
MYYVNEQQIRDRLSMIPLLQEGAEQLQQQWKPQDTLKWLAQERILHLAIEIVTDVGSSLIDGFIMRDASSYEDIMEIIYGESVIQEEVFLALRSLVKLRKPLVQQYMELQRGELYPELETVIVYLPIFSEQVETYLKTEL